MPSSESRLAVGQVVHRIDAPRVAGAMVRGLADPVHHRVAQIDVGRGHVDLRPQRLGPVGELARPHPRNRSRFSSTERSRNGDWPARLGQRAAVLADLIGRQIVDIRLAVLDELHRPLRRAARSNRRRDRGASPQSKPSQRMSCMIASTYSDSSFVGLVSSKRRLQWPPNSRAMPKSIEMALAWPMCKIAVRLGREARDHLAAEAAGAIVLEDDVANEVAGFRLVAHPVDGITPLIVVSLST